MLSLNKYLTKTEKSLDFIKKMENNIDQNFRGRLIRKRI